MAEIEETLKSVLVAGTSSVSATVHALRKPMAAALPAVVYRRISTLPHRHHASSGVTGLVKRDRFQITLITESYSELVTLSKLVDAVMVGNTTNFSATQPLGPAIEDKDETAKLYESIKDYYIWHKTT